jgi:uncharacterized protein YndB with AHSA1/START domain
MITRTFDAPPGLVFKVWTQPEHLVRWWGTYDFTTTSCDIDVRPGGTYRICIRSGEGIEHWMQGVYREVIEAERLVFTFSWDNNDQHKPGHGSPGHETLVTVTFAGSHGKTRLTFHQALFETTAARDAHLQGWSQFMERLAGYLADV